MSVPAGPTGESDAPADAGASTGLTTLVGGVGHLYQGDMDLGRRAAATLADEDLGQGVIVEELHYGAVAVTQRLEELAPDALILIGARERDGREPGAVERRRIGELDLDTEAVQGAVHDAAVGYVDVGLILDVAWGLGALPERTVTVEVEPLETGPDEALSAPAERGLRRALRLVREEVVLTPLFDLVTFVRDSLESRSLQDSEALSAMGDLLAALEVRDREGRWGRTFAERDRLQAALGDGRTSEGMDHADWGTWWALIEELDRLERWTGERVW